MLTLTDDAVQAVKALTSKPNTSGVRVSSHSESDPNPGFNLDYAAAPEPDDQIVEQAGATLYLDRVSARELDDKMLDAQRGSGGQLEFRIARQT